MLNFPRPDGVAVVCAVALLLSSMGFAQDVGTLNPALLPPVSHPENPKILAKEVFGSEKTPAPIEARSIVVDISAWYWHFMALLWIYVFALLGFAR